MTSTPFPVFLAFSAWIRFGPLLVFAFMAFLGTSWPAAAWSQETTEVATTTDDSKLTINRIFKDSKFTEKGFSANWLENGWPKPVSLQSNDRSASFTTLEPSAEYTGFKDIVRHDVETGEKQVVVAASELVVPGKTNPLLIEAYQWSNDHNFVLIYTNSVRVWRQNTRGDYWLLDRSSRQVRPLGGDGPKSSMMFAKFSPDGKQIAFVRNRNLFVEDLIDHSIRQLTFSQSENVINGTTDWVYEEEFGLRDAFHWSNDGKRIAYWQIDTNGVEQFPLVNNTDSLYPQITWYAYPKVGTRNPICRIGVVTVETAVSTWISLPGDPREHYVPRIHWIPNGAVVAANGRTTEEEAAGRLLIQQFNRLQNTNRLFVVDLDGGTPTVLMTESDDAWVDVHDELFWIDSGKKFTWLSDRSGWRHIYLVDTKTGRTSQVTSGQFDVVELLAVDENRKQLFFIASPDDPTERFLYRIGMDGLGLKRLTPESAGGTNQYTISPDAKWAIWNHSSMLQPATIRLVSLPENETVRDLELNTTLREKLNSLQPMTLERFRIPVDEAVEIDGWMLHAESLDKTQKHPALVYVYGEPAGSTTINRWGGNSFLWHRMLAEQGYVVMSFDNRGTKVPRGRSFRKSVYRQVGTLGPQDQAIALREVLRQTPHLDPERVGVWGWSGGGSSTLHAMFKYPELYKVGISVAPVPNQRYYDTIYQERYMGLPDTNVEGYRNGSPISFANQLSGDLLIIHGTGDDNCHYQTVEMLINELVAHNKPFQMMAYPNRSHAIRERKNTTLHLRQLMTRFLNERLASEPPILSESRQTQPTSEK